MPKKNRVKIVDVETLIEGGNNSDLTEMPTNSENALNTIIRQQKSKFKCD
jgi:hypothetical protein